MLVHVGFGSVRPLVIIGIPASLLSGLLLYRLGPYPQWDAQSVPATVGAAPV